MEDSERMQLTAKLLRDALHRYQRATEFTAFGDQSFTLAAKPLGYNLATIKGLGGGTTPIRKSYRAISNP
jgi:hypothetical protein